MYHIESIPELAQFITAHHIHAQKHNEREWGSFEIAMTVGTEPTYAFAGSLVFGSLFTVDQAIENTLRIFSTDPQQRMMFTQWLGDDRMKELLTALRVI